MQTIRGFLVDGNYKLSEFIHSVSGSNFSAVGEAVLSAVRMSEILFQDQNPVLWTRNSEIIVDVCTVQTGYEFPEGAKKGWTLREHAASGAFAGISFDENSVENDYVVFPLYDHVLGVIVMVYQVSNDLYHTFRARNTS